MRNRERRKYWTGLIPLGHEEFQPDLPFRGAGWNTTLSLPKNRPHLTKERKELILHASTWSTAQRALDLIHGCRLLIRGPDVFEITLIAHNAEEPVWLKGEERIRLQQFLSTTDIPMACAIAAKASTEKVGIRGHEVSVQLGVAIRSPCRSRTALASSSYLTFSHRPCYIFLCYHCRSFSD